MSEVLMMMMMMNDGDDDEEASGKWSTGILAKIGRPS
jgi:hypothetical protein